MIAGPLKSVLDAADRHAEIVVLVQRTEFVPGTFLMATE
jgi:hypothetical protein